MRGGATGMSAASQMSGLGCGSDKGSAAAAAAAAAASAMQFPLSQRRKRRVLFTQAQVCQFSLQMDLNFFLIREKYDEKKRVCVFLGSC